MPSSPSCSLRQRFLAVARTATAEFLNAPSKCQSSVRCCIVCSGWLTARGGHMDADRTSWRRRIVVELAAAELVRRLKGREVHQRHRVQDQMHDVVLGQPVPHVRRQQEGLATFRATEVVGHASPRVGSRQGISPGSPTQAATPPLPLVDVIATAIQQQPLWRKIYAARQQRRSPSCVRRPYGLMDQRARRSSIVPQRCGPAWKRGPPSSIA